MRKKQTQNKLRIKNKAWFGPHCRSKKSQYDRARKAYKENNNNLQNRNLLNRASKEYKRTMRYYINKHNFINESKLRKLNKIDPKGYWTF
jgi:hypothetical protein